MAVDLLAEVQANVARQLLLHDVVPSIEHDFEEFQRVIAAAPDWNDKGHPAFDPKYNTLTPDNAFWTCFRDSRGEVVWCAGNRIHRNASFVELVRTRRLIYDGTREMGDDKYLLAYEDDFANIRGTLCYMGSAWVHPRMRGNALPTLGLALAQAKMIQDYDCDFSLAALRTVLMTKGVAVNTYRYSHYHYGVIWRREAKNEDMECWLMYQNRTDMERELARWLTPEREPAALRLIA